MSSESYPDHPEKAEEEPSREVGPSASPDQTASTESWPAAGPPAYSGLPQQDARAQVSPTQIWGLRDLLYFILFIPASLILANLAALAGYAILKPLLGWHVSARSLSRNTFFLLSLQSVFYAFILGYIYLLATLYHRQPFWKSLGWRKPSERQVFTYLLGGILMAIIVTIAPPVLPDSSTFPLQQFFSSPAASYAVGVFAIVIAPIVEETVFRGLLFAVFERSVGLRFAVVTTAVLFAGLHVPEYWHAWNHILMILLVGFVFSLARGMTGSLAPSIVLHISYNGCMMAGLYLATRHFRDLQGLLLP